MKNNFYDNYTIEEVERLKTFFKDLDSRCTISKKHLENMHNDFKNAFLYYKKKGLSLLEAIKLLDLANLGGFYSRPATLWLPLDDVAKSYTTFINRNQMAVFRLSAYLYEDIIPEILQMALNFTIKRFLCFAMTLKKGFFWHYLESTKKRFSIEKDSSIPVQRIRLSLSGSQAFKVLYYENRISVEFFHGMTDGTGALQFLKSLLAEYVKLLGVEIQNSNLYYDINDIPDFSEYNNEFLKIDKKPDSNAYINSGALQLSGKVTKNKPCKVLHFNMNAYDLKRVSENYGVTVTTYITSLMMLSSKSCVEKINGEISVCIPVNMRKYYESKTLRNFSLYCQVRENIGEINDLATLTKDVSEKLKVNSSKEVMADMKASTSRMIKNIRFIPLILKSPVMKILFNVFGDRVFTTTLSNLGVVKLPDDLSKYVKKMDFVLGTGVINRVLCSLITVNDVSTLSIAKLTIDPLFEEKMLEFLTKDGIKVEVEGSECYGH